MAFLNACYAFLTSSATLNIAIRTMLMAVVTSSFFTAIDMHLPVPAALEELTVVGLLLLLELGFFSRRQTGSKKLRLERKGKDDDATASLQGRLQVAAKAGDTENAEAAMESGALEVV